MTAAALAAMCRAAAAKGEAVMWLPSVRQFVAAKPPGGVK